MRSIHKMVIKERFPREYKKLIEKAQEYCNNHPCTFCGEKLIIDGEERQSNWSVVGRRVVKWIGIGVSCPNGCGGHIITVNVWRYKKKW